MGLTIARASVIIINCFCFCIQVEFLSEADQMKQLNHDNIIQLLAVCTIGEPVYIIMELMIHGRYNRGGCENTLELMIHCTIRKYLYIIP